MAELWIGWASLLTYVVGLDTLFAVGTFYKLPAMTHLGLVPWFLFLAVAYLVDKALWNRGISLGNFTALHGGYWLILSLLGNIWWMEPMGLAPRLFSLVFYGLSVFQLSVLVKEGTKANKTLVQTEITVLLLAVILLLEGSVLPAGNELHTPLVLLMICNLISLVLCRVVTENKVKVEFGKARGMLFLVLAVVAMVVVAIGLLLTFSQQGRALVEGLTQGVTGGAQWMVTQVERFLQWLLSFLPGVEPGQLPDMEPVSSSGETASGGEGDVAGLLLKGMGAIAAVVAVCLVVYILKNRGQRLGGAGNPRAKSPLLVQNRLLQRLLEKWRRLKKGLIFRFQCLRYGNSPQAVLVAAEHYGKQAGLPRLKGETMRHYLERLGQGLEQSTEDIAQLCDCLDGIFYGKKDGSLPGEQIKRLKKTFASLPKEEKQEKA